MGMGSEKLKERPPTTIMEELRQSVFRVWGEITPDVVDRLYLSIPRRVALLLRGRY